MRSWSCLPLHEFQQQESLCLSVLENRGNLVGYKMDIFKNSIFVWGKKGRVMERLGGRERTRGGRTGFWKTPCKSRKKGIWRLVALQAAQEWPEAIFSYKLSIMDILLRTKKKKKKKRTIPRRTLFHHAIPCSITSDQSRPKIRGWWDDFALRWSLVIEHDITWSNSVLHAGWFHYPGQKNWDSHAPAGAGAWSVEHARACSLTCVAVSIFLARVVFLSRVVYSVSKGVRVNGCDIHNINRRFTRWADRVCCLVAMVIWSWMSNVANRGQNVPVGWTSPTDTIGPRSRSRLSPRYVLVVLKWWKNRSIFTARRAFSFDIVQSNSFLCQPADEHNREAFVCESDHSRLATIIVNVPVAVENLPVVWMAYKRLHKSPKVTANRNGLGNQRFTMNVWRVSKDQVVTSCFIKTVNGFVVSASFGGVVCAPWWFNISCLCKP